MSVVHAGALGRAARERGACFSLIFCFALGAACAGAGETTASLAADAVRLTARGQLAEAEATYRRLIDLDPSEGFVRLVRFYAASGQTTSAAALLSSAEVNSLAAPERVRVALAAGATTEAQRLVAESSDRTTSGGGASAQHAMLRATVLMNAGQRDSAVGELTRAALDSRLTGADRVGVFRRLLQTGAPDAVASATLPLLTDLANADQTSYDVLHELAIGALIAMPDGEVARGFRDELTSASRGGSVVATWVESIAAVRRGAQNAALQSLQKRYASESTTATRLLLGRALQPLLGDDRAAGMRLLEELVTLSGGAPSLRLQAAQLAYKMQDFPRAQRHLRGLDTSGFDEGQMWAWRNVTVGNIGKVGSHAALLDQFEEVAKGLPYAQVRELAEAPWVRLGETADQSQVHEALMKRIAQPGAAPELHILRMSLENQLRNPDGVMAALEDYVKARPGEFDALEELGALHGARVFHMAKVLSSTDKATTPPEFHAAADAAARALWKAAEARPYQPEAYGRLMALYALTGETDKARRVPRYLLEHNEEAPEAIAQAAYIYATNDLPAEALPLYEKAIKLRPDDQLVRLNYAGALTRVGRYRDAEGIYWSLIEHGAHGKQYHIHEVYANAYSLAEKSGRMDAFLGFLAGLLPKQTVTQRDEFLLNAGKLLVHHGKADAALPFYEALIREFPARADEGQGVLIRAHVARRDFDAADKLIVEAEAASSSDEAQIAARFGRADLAREKGDLEAAVRLWTELADAYPARANAVRGLLAAAQLLAEHGDRARAGALLQRFVDLGVGDDEDNHAAARLREELAQQP